LQACSTWSELFDGLVQWVSRKTRTCKNGCQMPEQDADRVRCDLKWENFWMTEAEVRAACQDTVLQYAACVVHDAAAGAVTTHP